MTQNSKPKVIQSYEKLSQETREQLKLYYPDGYVDYLIEFPNSKGEIVSALPFETDEKVYMVRMSIRKAQALIDDDSDYDEDGMLLQSKREKYEDKYSDADYLFSDFD
ncbi:hypothetical protein [Ancylomarina sp. 16SWW S1-10-2]|uniref:hypothetical protein n=1 Tax=Ancylomarina sp. 16SWW S1-10-2 TaxID=2499681 RepID=UPI0012AD9711|nr:hypothetical protein [Ancylomarina sp. 16SWW S1-10-2]MRT93944.1 hypothetical protein [Ancylomarina sp. 16SWW S1-10-2]